ncbi:MAG: TrmJ/YjtD family RNA methyltransferase [Candidatus Methanofastidiosia archaeon]
MISCIMVEPESAGNIGSVARSMSNFNITGPLILINPCDITDEAYMMACNAGDVIDNAIIVGSYREALSLVDFSVATSCEPGHEYNVRRIALLPENIGGAMAIECNTGIVLGRESSGLTNKEIEMSDMLVTIPTHEKYQTLNVSHAASIIFYELFKLSVTPSSKQIKIKGASFEEKEMIFKDFDIILNEIDKREYRIALASIIFKRIISRSFITSREAYTLKGVLRKIILRLQ